ISVPSVPEGNLTPGEGLLITGTQSGSTVTILPLADDVADTVGKATALEFIDRQTDAGQAVGDDPNGLLDVDMYQVTLPYNTTLHIDVDATELGSLLQSCVRVFDAGGSELAVALVGDPAFDISLQAGTYYIGLSSQANNAYDPMLRAIALDDGHHGAYLLYLSYDPQVDLESPIVQNLIVSPINDGSSTTDVYVTFTDDVAIEVSTLDSLDIGVTGPNSFSQFAEFVSLDIPGNGTPKTVAYRITAPHGSWNEGDNGYYFVWMQPDQTSDTSGKFVEGGLLGTFAVSINAIDFPDPNLQTAVENALGMNFPTPTDILALTSLDVTQKGIFDLTGLEYATNVTELFLSGNNIHDILPISSLTSLNDLRIDANPLNTSAYCLDIPLIESNNPGIYMQYDSNLNPLTNDCSTNLVDFAAFAGHWRETGCDKWNNFCDGADLNHIDDVDGDDLAEFCRLWLAGIY
ncbi:MAG: hypothetical protein KAR47_15600, partial [Planctomycetes bacterium]|nr:hypothetical protein [Planctomycetota bacterium]